MCRRREIWIAPEHSLPIGAGLGNGNEERIGVFLRSRTWNLLVLVGVFEVTVSEPMKGLESLVGMQRKVTDWSFPTHVPDLASPIYCICLHHSLSPTHRTLRRVLKSDIILRKSLFARVCSTTFEVKVELVFHISDVQNTKYHTFDGPRDLTGYRNTT